MLRVVAHKSAAAALKYFTEGLAREDYYSEKQEVVGKWFGKAAQLLGLSSNVTREAFAALVENRHPETGKPLTPRTKADRRVGYDLNFHAPKSLSLMHALTGDERIVGAFRSAVAETMAEIEEMTATRIRRGGAQKERFTGNLVWAEFVHFTARPVDGIPDPHLHVHAFAMNVTHDEVEGRWKAASWAGIKKDAPYSEAVFRSRLAEKIAGLGYGIERKVYSWEIAGVPRALVEKFSRRTAQIEQLAKLRGITDPKVLDALGATSREGKRHGITKAELQALWNYRLMPGEVSLLKNLRAGKPVPLTERITPERAFQEAEEKVFAKNSAVEVKRLVAEALHFGVGQLTPERAWSEFAKRGMVVRDVDGEKLCTSRTVLTEEILLINAAREGRSRSAAFVSGKLRFADARLSDEQRHAANHILKSRDQIIGLRGVAGAGKTTLITEIVSQIEKGGLRVFAFAPSARASRGTLREAGFADAQTVAHLLHNKQLQDRTRGQVILVDEAGTLGIADMLHLMRIAGTSTRIILVGDIEQHVPVARGEPFRLMQHYSGLRIAELTEIRRQEVEEYRKAVAALSKGDLRTGFRRLEEIGAIIEILDDAERYRMLAQDFVALSRGASMPLAVSPTHLEIGKVTDAIRELRRDVGQLGTDRSFVQYHDLKWEEPDRRRVENYQTGLVVQFNQNAKGIRRGALFKVVGTDGGRIRIVDPDGGKMDLPLKEASRFSVFEERRIALAKGDRIRITKNGKSSDGKRLNNGDLAVIASITKEGRIVLKNGAVLDQKHGHVAYGYAQTSHSVQSATSRDVLIAQSSDSLFVSSREQFYVSVSRGRKTVRIYTDDVKQLQEAVGNTSKRRAAVELAGFTKEQIAGIMSGELDATKWRDMIQSRRGEGQATKHVENLLRERRSDSLVKNENLDFRQYINMRRANSGADGKSRSKGHPGTLAQKRQGSTLKGKSFLRPTELTTPTKEKVAAPKKKPPSEAAKLEKPKEQKAAKAIRAAKSHFQKVATRTKTAVQSFKKGVRSKLFPERSTEQIAKQKAKKQTGHPPKKGPEKNRTVKKAPTPPAPTPRRR